MGELEKLTSTSGWKLVGCEGYTVADKYWQEKQKGMDTLNWYSRGLSC